MRARRRRAAAGLAIALAFAGAPGAAEIRNESAQLVGAIVELRLAQSAASDAEAERHLDVARALLEALGSVPEGDRGAVARQFFEGGIVFLGGERSLEAGNVNSVLEDVRRWRMSADCDKRGLATVSTIDGLLEIVAGKSTICLRVQGIDEVGDPMVFTAGLECGGADLAEIGRSCGLTLAERDGRLVIEDVAFDSIAQQAMLDWDFLVLAAGAR